MIDNYKYWKKFNTSRNNLVKKILKFNNTYKFNYLEKEHYNHTRDILALSLINIKKKNKPIKILDYGSNLLTLSNLNNKIDTLKYQFTIYDPFLKNEEKLYKIKKINYEFSNDLNKICSQQFSLINFGSSIQYQQNYFNQINKLDLSKTELIIFTSTPLSLGGFYCCKQTNYLNITQNIYSFNDLINKLKAKKFRLVFKSRNEDKYIACKKQKYKTLSLNLIFKKNV